MLTGLDWVKIRYELVGAQKAVAQWWELNKAVGANAMASDRASLATQRLTKSQFMHNQALFTGRRLMFYSTLALLGMGAAIVKLGFSYSSTLQQAQVALAPMITPTSKLNAELHRLFQLAALSPFQFKDVVKGFTTFYRAAKLTGIGVGEVHRTLKNVSDALSGVPGAATAQNLNRVTVAFQHMLNLGRPTGRLMYQLANLGIPIEAVLKKQLHLTDIQIRNIARSGITTRQVLDAFNKFVETTKGFAGMGMETQLKTLQGTWSSFKDFLSQAAGGGTGGMFNFLTKAFHDIDVQLGKKGLQGGAVTMTDMARAMDQTLTPQTHLLIDVFTLLEYTLKGVVGTFMGLYKTLSLILYPIAQVLSLFGANIVAMKLLGILLGLSIGLWGAYKVAVVLATVVTDIASIATQGLRRAILLLMGTEGLKGATGALRTFAMRLGITTAVMEALEWQFLLMRETIAKQGLLGALRMLAIRLWSVVPAAAALVAEGVALAIAWWPVTLVVLAIAALTIGLYILYKKWKPFHDLVDDTWKWFQKNWYWAKYFIGVFGPIGGIVQSFVLLRDTLRDIFDLINHPMKSGGGLMGLLHKAYQVTAPYTRIPFVGKYADPFHYLPQHKRRQAGGYASGMTVVGERGPEMVRLPQGSRVFNQTQMGAGFAGGGALIIKVVPQSIFLDGRKVGEVVSQVVTSKEARG